MSVKMIRMALGGSGPVRSWSNSIQNFGNGTGTLLMSVSLYTDGHINGTNFAGSPAWYSPVGGTPGNSYWVKFTDSGAAWDAGLVAGTLYQLNTIRTLTWTLGIGAIKTGTVTTSIYSDAGGTNLVGSGTITFDGENTP